MKSIDAASVAYALHGGLYGDYDATYLKLNAMIRQTDHRPADSPMGIYLSGPAQTPAADLLTAICVAVEPAPGGSGDRATAAMLRGKGRGWLDAAIGALATLSTFSAGVNPGRFLRART